MTLYLKAQKARTRLFIMSEHKLPALVPMTPEQIAAKMAGGHSVFSPSGAEMTTTCLGSLIPNALAEDETTFEAAEGTVAHGVGEDWIKADFERPDHYIGKIEDCRGHEIEITEEMLGFLEDYVNGCQELAERSEHFSSEQRVNVSDLTPIPKQGGTLDFCGFTWQELEIIDLKYGKEPVFAFYEYDQKPNLQLVIYAWGIFLKWDWLYNFQRIKLRICQPRLPHVWSEHTLTREELIYWADYVRERWALAWVPNAPRTPSIRGCRWCKIRATCPALYLFMAKDLDVFDNHDEDIPEGEYTVVEMETANEVILDDMAISPFPKMPKPPELSTAALAKLLRYRKFMENFFNSVSAELLDRAISKEENIPWWKLVESRTRRRLVEDEEYIVETLLAVSDELTVDDLYETKLKSPAGLERTLHTKAKIKLVDAKRILEDGLTVKPPGQKTLAPTSDNRAELAKDGDVFDVWEDDDDI